MFGWFAARFVEAHTCWASSSGRQALAMPVCAMAAAPEDVQLQRVAAAFRAAGENSNFAVNA